LPLLIGMTAANLSAAVAPIAIVHGNTRFEAKTSGGVLRESFSVRNKSGWISIAKGAGKTQGALSVRSAGSAVLPGKLETLARQGDSVVEEIVGDGWRAKRTIEALRARNWIHISTVLTPARPLTLHSLSDSFQSELRPDWSFSPSVGGFNPDGQYKSPLILVQAETNAFAVVPDLLSLDRASLKRCQHSLDLDASEKPQLSVGHIPSKQAYHTVFKEDLDRTWTATDAVTNSYYLYVTGDAPAHQAYREAVRFEWTQFGHPAMATAADEQTGTDPRYSSCHLWDEWRDAVWERESRESWLKVAMPDGTIGGAVMMRRAHAPKPSVYLTAWFNSLRTALGMALYARRTHSDVLMGLATQTLNLAAKAPGRNGAFKCFAVPNDSGNAGKPEQVFWGAGDGAGTSVSSGYLGFDMSWTGYWMLRWLGAGLPDNGSVFPRCVRLAEFLIARQRPDGFLPTRFDEAGQVEQDLSTTVAAETAPVVRFLLELSKFDENPKYQTAALKGLAFLDQAIVPQRKWFDFETFWSCSPRLISFDARTRQWPANNLALIHAVAAYLQAFEITHQPRYLDKGKALLDYLLLYQQSWTNPALENLTSPSMLLGGFTTQNSDAEWSDARQTLAGEVILDYYRVTHEPEYLERGVEALRAQFPVSPSENWAHVGYGHKAGVSSFHWGTGSGMAGIELEQEVLRDGVCDVPSGRCVGVNGLNIGGWHLNTKGGIELQIDTPYIWKRKPKLIFYGVQRKRDYKISVNGSDALTFSGEQMQSGVELPIPAERTKRANL